MPRLLSFPFPTEAVPNEPITDERIALTNAVVRTLKTWIAEHEGVTADDLKWALVTAGDCIVEGRDDADENGGA